MSTFNQSTTRLLLAAAAILGAGVYYQDVTSQKLDLARQSLDRLRTAQGQAAQTTETAREYADLLSTMVSRNIDRQEPYAIASEFSPGEVDELATLLGDLYTRDGYFFLQHFQLSWQAADAKLNRLPSVALDLEGRKVLLFSSDARRDVTAGTASR